MTTLWRGATPTIARAIVVNAAQLGTYSQAKDSAKSMMAGGQGDASGRGLPPHQREASNGIPTHDGTCISSRHGSR